MLGNYCVIIFPSWPSDLLYQYKYYHTKCTTNIQFSPLVVIVEKHDIVLIYQSLRSISFSFTNQSKLLKLKKISRCDDLTPFVQCSTSKETVAIHDFYLHYPWHIVISFHQISQLHRILRDIPSQLKLINNYSYNSNNLPIIMESSIYHKPTCSEDFITISS